MQWKHSFGTPRNTPHVCRTSRATTGETIRWVDSDWAADVLSRKRWTGGVVKAHGPVVEGFWSKLHSNVALSSAEVQLNSSVKGLSERVGIFHLYQRSLGGILLSVCSLMPALAKVCCCDICGKNQESVDHATLRTVCDTESWDQCGKDSSIRECR